MHDNDENPNVHIYEHRWDFVLTGAVGAYPSQGENPGGMEMVGEEEEETLVPMALSIGPVLVAMHVVEEEGFDVHGINPHIGGNLQRGFQPMVRSLPPSAAPQNQDHEVRIRRWSQGGDSCDLRWVFSRRGGMMQHNIDK